MGLLEQIPATHEPADDAAARGAARDWSRVWLTLRSNPRSTDPFVLTGR